MSNPRKPSEQREREGNAGHRPVPPTLAIGGRELVEPTHLGASALERWRDLVRCLGGPAGILATADTATIEAAAIAWARARTAGADVEARGQIVDGKANPSVRIERDAWTSFRMLSQGLGLSPADRARLAALGVAGGGDVPAAPDAGEDDDQVDVPGIPRLAIVKGKVA